MPILPRTRLPKVQTTVSCGLTCGSNFGGLTHSVACLTLTGGWLRYLPRSQEAAVSQLILDRNSSGSPITPTEPSQAASGLVAHYARHMLPLRAERVCLRGSTVPSPQRIYHVASTRCVVAKSELVAPWLNSLSMLIRTRISSLGR